MSQVPGRPPRLGGEAPATGRHRFSPRRVSFSAGGHPADWVPGDPHTTQVVNVLHLLLPAGERWFCQLYRLALPLVADEDLRRDVRAFIGQEAVHARAHQAVLDELRGRGVDARPFTDAVERLFRVGRIPALPAWLPAPLRRQAEQHLLLDLLAVVAAIEHFTAVLGWWVLVSRGLDEAGADPQMVALLRWHGAEEVEHRSVAFDTYRALGGGYARRCAAMVGVATAMVVLWSAGTRFLLRTTGAAVAPSFRAFVRAGRRGLLPRTGLLAAAVPRYLAPGYHPSHEGRTGVAVAYLSTAPGVSGPTG